MQQGKFLSQQLPTSASSPPAFPESDITDRDENIVSDKEVDGVQWRMEITAGAAIDEQSATAIAEAEICPNEPLRAQVVETIGGDLQVDMDTVGSIVNQSFHDIRRQEAQGRLEKEIVMEEGPSTLAVTSHVLVAREGFDVEGNGTMTGGLPEGNVEVSIRGSTPRQQVNK